MSATQNETAVRDGFNGRGPGPAPVFRPYPVSMLRRSKRFITEVALAAFRLESPYLVVGIASQTGSSGGFRTL